MDSIQRVSDITRLSQEVCRYQHSDNLIISLRHNKANRLRMKKIQKIR